VLDLDAGRLEPGQRLHFEGHMIDDRSGVPPDDSPWLMNTSTSGNATTSALPDFAGTP
jgi:hypothetical protein